VARLFANPMATSKIAINGATNLPGAAGFGSGARENAVIERLVVLDEMNRHPAFLAVKALVVAGRKKSRIWPKHAAQSARYP